MKQRRPSRAVLRGVFFASLAIALSVPATIAGASAARPSAPRAVRASFASGEVRVRWSPPASNGGSRVTSYLVTSLPAKGSCRTSKTTCVVKGLSLGSSYAFKVVARSSGGASAGATSNRVRMPSAGSLFLAQASKLNAALAADQVAIDNATTAPQLNIALDALQKTYGNFISSLVHVRWPTDVEADIASLAIDVANVSADEVNAYEATETTAATSFDTLQGASIADTEADAQVRTVLGLPQLILGPITTTSPATGFGTAQVVHDFTGDALSVTVTQVVDPATAGSGSGGPDTGFRFIAIELAVSAPAGSVEGDANYSMTVTGTDGKTYTANFGAVSECTNFTYGLFDLLADDSASGCVAFQLPTSIGVQSVQFSLASGYLDSGTWT